MTIHVHVFFEDFSHLIYACVIHSSYCTEVFVLVFVDVPLYFAFLHSYLNKINALFCTFLSFKSMFSHTTPIQPSLFF